MKHISFPSINQFRQVIKNVRSSAEYHGVPYPVVTFEATVKLHGTNAGICRPFGGSIDDIWVQSRENIITPLKDNAGCAMFVHANKDLINEIFDKIEDIYHTSGKDAGEDDVVQIFGEFFGSTIQKGVGVSGLPKMLNIFGIRVSPGSDSSAWETKEFYTQIFQQEFLNELNSNNIYHKYQFTHWYVDVNFSSPEVAQNQLVELCTRVEQDCPVARFFKQDADANTLVGEGIVCTPLQTESIGFDVRQHFFKVKGEKHSSSKVKTTASVDVEKVASVDAFVEYALTTNRLEQGFSKLEEMGLPRDVTSTGKYIGWCVQDTIKEELDTLAESGLTPKDVTGKLSTKARQYFLENL